jgi:hypothetical protein
MWAIMDPRPLVDAIPPGPLRSPQRDPRIRNAAGVIFRSVEKRRPNARGMGRA